MSDKKLTRKRCSMCKKELPLDHFYRSSKSKDGYQWACKECTKKYRKQGSASRSKLAFYRKEAIHWKQRYLAARALWTTLFLSLRAANGGADADELIEMVVAVMKEDPRFAEVGDAEAGK